MKTVLLIVSALLLIFGWGMGMFSLSIGGSVVYILALVVDMVFLIKDSKQYKKGQFIKVETTKTWFQKFSKFLEGLIMLAGLVVWMINKGELSYSGAIIWLGTILIYFVSGIVVQEITNIPLKMAYGGWDIVRKRRK